MWAYYPSRNQTKSTVERPGRPFVLPYYSDIQSTHPQICTTTQTTSHILLTRLLIAENIYPRGIFATNSALLYAANPTQQPKGAKKRIFGIFEAFFDLYTPQKRRKHDTSFDFAAFLRQRRFLPFAAPFAAPFVSKICANSAAKTPQVAVPQKRRKI